MFPQIRIVSVSSTRHSLLNMTTKMNNFRDAASYEKKISKFYIFSTSNYLKIRNNWQGVSRPVPPIPSFILHKKKKKGKNTMNT